jgi:hypothetical protein
MRVLHVPHARFPFARRLARPGAFGPVNGCVVGDVVVPDALSYASLLRKRQRFWTAVDAVHVHFGFEFEPPAVVCQALAALQRRKVPLVYTCHELESVHRPPPNAYRRCLQAAIGAASGVAALTTAAAEALGRMYGREAGRKTRVIPHGTLCDLADLPGSLPDFPSGERLRLCLFGAFRANRELVSTVPALYFGAVRGTRRRLTLITKPPFFEDAGQAAAGLALLSLFALSRKGLELVLRPDYDDGEVLGLLRRQDVLVLPYLFSSHSGQMELAWDLGLVPIVTDLGFQQAQYEELSTPHRPPCHFVRWRGAPHELRSRRMVEAVEAVGAARAAVNGWRRTHWADWRAFRRRQRDQILDAYEALYRGA